MLHSKTSRRLWSLLLLVPAVLVSVGCESILGEWVSRTPNHGKPLEKIDRVEPLALDDAVIDHEFRIEVESDDPVSLWVWVIDPSNEKFMGIETKEDDPDHLQPLFHIDHNAPRQTREPVATVLMLHGFYDWINRRWYLMWARMLAEHGYRVVLVDQRGHGRSTGKWATYGVRESRDMQRVLDELEERNLLAGPVGVWGVSFGGATAVQLADLDERIEAMVLISTFTSMRDIVPDYGRAIGFRFLSDEQYTRVVDHAGRHADFDPDDADVIDRLARIDTPTLLIHGEEDRLIPIQHAMRLYHAADRDNVELIRVMGANHTSLGDTVVWPIYQPMLDWFERHLLPEEEQTQVANEAHSGQTDP
ncbi:alpha/beta hydrolase [Algisphaera agarilytica]|uniref:Pimeloyl-ACP methyl ester carboxylesterase n=1 Tax=Algisphaera agarilytica TaxID=1385975 RepID=A0A7X0H6A6_9BACT|nr:alpha/beta fold hydrolase [Algisphaera agarilytica]MBB6430088.1 pimeloyl-ACP methyl ester carboxylesterase [Algisphaera agarilytica]